MGQGSIQTSGPSGPVFNPSEVSNNPTFTGVVTNRASYRFGSMPAPDSTLTGDASLTDAQMLAGLLVCTPAAAAAYTVRTGTQILAAVQAVNPGFQLGDYFELTIINLGGTGDDITMTVATDVTFVGDALVRPIADTGTEHAGQGTFRFRWVTGTTFVGYRVS